MILADSNLASSEPEILNPVPSPYNAAVRCSQAKEESSNGIESIISKVENLLTEGNIAKAADVLEGGVRGSEAEEVANDWVRQARNRAIAEQALCLLHSHAMSVTFS